MNSMSDEFKRLILRGKANIIEEAYAKFYTPITSMKLTRNSYEELVIIYYSGDHEVCRGNVGRVDGDITLVFNDEFECRMRVDLK